MRTRTNFSWLSKHRETQILASSFSNNNSELRLNYISLVHANFLRSKTSKKSSPNIGTIPSCPSPKSCLLSHWWMLMYYGKEFFRIRKNLMAIQPNTTPSFNDIIVTARDAEEKSFLLWLKGRLRVAKIARWSVCNLFPNMCNDEASRCSRFVSDLLLCWTTEGEKGGRGCEKMRVFDGKSYFRFCAGVNGFFRLMIR